MTWTRVPTAIALFAALVACSVKVDQEPMKVGVEYLTVLEDNYRIAAVSTAPVILKPSSDQRSCVVVLGKRNAPLNRYRGVGSPGREISYTREVNSCRGHQILVVEFGAEEEAYAPDFCEGRCGSRFISGTAMPHQPGGAGDLGAAARIALPAPATYLTTRIGAGCSASVTGYNLFDMKGEQQTTICFLPARASLNTARLLLGQCLEGASRPLNQLDDRLCRFALF